MIRTRHLTKRYGDTSAVEDLSLDVRPGRVTGFLGPNGAGKSTTMRLILGLDTPTAGSAEVNGQSYRNLPVPLREVGALLDGRAAHPGRSAYHHLLYLAQANGLPRRRVDDVLDEVGLTAVARRRTKTYSLGMGQRLGIAAALLGEPSVLILDEPINGLDTDGIRWLRTLLRQLAADGRTVLLSSHLMSEMELTADHLVVIGGGRLLADTDMQSFLTAHAHGYTMVRAAEGERLRDVLCGAGGTVRPDRRGAWRVDGLDAATIGELACAQRIVLHELTPHRDSLEDAYARLTDQASTFRARAAAA
ncbi:ABC transporter ATP-binding protein [Cryptosporangium aurantiacum]|uniref:ABC-2 type transport system ATP-binding protein n=1 Tax=Cryptosporangium aurantiacum TaxID=134849 RepID=A0A1M7Q3M7_9ACTN|nr:ABC transporter ATP-binding protein [Cryptosporangium aurantiacum]SHN24798.1 ABC-2 type transport system ATP-binding protein [Cryptosporangium aurantiacum]